MVIEVPTCSRVLRSARNETHTLARESAGNNFPGKFVPSSIPFVMVAQGQSQLFEEVIHG